MASRFIDLSGKVFQRLTVLERSTVKISGKPSWLCSCVCGSTRYATTSQLKRGQVTHCGNHFIDLTGNVYDRLTVLHKVDDPRPGSHYLCRCLCGTEKVIKGHSLQIGATRSCKCLLREGNKLLPTGEASRNATFSMFRYSAKSRDLCFDLDDEFLEWICSLNCIYDHTPPSNVNRSKCGTGDFVYGGIDRIDSSSGYTIDNVVPCCWTCNRMKGDLTWEDFWIHISRISRVASGPLLENAKLLLAEFREEVKQRPSPHITQGKQ